MLSDWFAMSIVTALIWGCMPVFEKHAVNAISDQFATVMIRCIGVALGLVLIPLISPGVMKSIPTVPIRAWILLLATGFVGSVVGQVTYMTAMKHGEVSRVTPIAASWPLLALLIAVLFLGEPLTLKKACAVVMTVGGLALLRL